MDKKVNCGTKTPSSNCVELLRSQGEDIRVFHRVFHQMSIFGPPGDKYIFLDKRGLTKLIEEPGINRNFFSHPVRQDSMVSERVASVWVH